MEQYIFSIKNKDSLDENYSYIFDVNDLYKNESYYELVIDNKKYYFSNYSQDFCFEKDKILIINMWNNIAVFSLENGEMLFYSGLSGLFVGVEELKMDFLIITDNTLFLIDKRYFYPWGFKTFTDHIQDYKLYRDDYNITLNFAVEDETTIKLNTV